MATLVLSAAGMAIGGAIGGTVAGISAAAIGRFAGAVIGRAVDQRPMGQSGGSAPVETGRIDRFRLTGASEGTPIGQVYGRMRMGGQVIWSTRFQERISNTLTGGRGGKGSSPAPTQTVTQYSYSVSFAVAICEGPITHS